MLGDANCRGTRQLKEKRNKIAEAPRIAGLQTERKMLPTAALLVYQGMAALSIHMLVRSDRSPQAQNPLGLFPAFADFCCCSRSWLKAASKACQNTLSVRLAAVSMGEHSTRCSTLETENQTVHFGRWQRGECFEDLSHWFYQPRYFMPYIRLRRFLYSLHDINRTNDYYSQANISPKPFQ